MRTAARAIVVKDDQLLIMKRDKFGQKFCALPGGGVDLGERPEQTVVREVLEETSIDVQNPRLVILEHAGPMFGDQYIYICDYVEGEAKLQPDSIEAKITADGKNLYEPAWMPVAEVADSNMLPVELRDLLAEKLKNGWDDQPIELTVRA